MSVDLNGEESKSRREHRKIQLLQLKVARLELKLQDMVELLHMWKDEASSYRWLAEAVVNGDYPLAKAKRTLERCSARKRLQDEV